MILEFPMTIFLLLKMLIHAHTSKPWFKPTLETQITFEYEVEHYCLFLFYVSIYSNKVQCTFLPQFYCLDFKYR